MREGIHEDALRVMLEGGAMREVLVSPARRLVYHRPDLFCSDRLALEKE